VVRALISPRRKLLQQAREIRSLKAELAQLRALNESMREGMRRCITCEYRLAVRDNKE